MPEKDNNKDPSIYILPTLFTIGNLFCGYFAIVSSIGGEFQRAAGAIGIAILLDTLDGRIARMTDTTSKFGIQLDSLADMISFGVAPSILVYFWAFDPFEQLGYVGWLIAFLFIISGAMRLARFNIEGMGGHPNFFIGLPVPAGAWTVGAMVFFHPARIESFTVSALVMFSHLALAFMMVSTLKFRSFKDLDLKSPKPTSAVLILALAVVTIALNPKLVFLLAIVIYICSGILRYVSDRFDILSYFIDGENKEKI